MTATLLEVQDQGGGVQLNLVVLYEDPDLKVAIKKVFTIPSSDVERMLTGGFDALVQGQGQELLTVQTVKPSLEALIGQPITIKSKAEQAAEVEPAAEATLTGKQ